MKYRFIDTHRSEFSVVKMCRTLNVSESGFYDWLKRPASVRATTKKRLMEKISHLFHTVHNRMAGSPTITHDLHDDHEYQSVHRSRVAAIMREMGLKCRIQRKYVVTTDSKHDKPVAPNILNRNFNPELPHRYLVGDITYLKVASRWIYLSVFIDLFSRKVVGWDLSGSLAADSTCRAFRKYIQRYGCSDGLLVHSDRGIQYACEEFGNLLSSVDAQQSMSRKGNCWDNAVAESFFHTLKTRLTYHRKYNSPEELERDIYWYIEIYYNRVRKHSANNWMTPEMKESKFYEMNNAA